MAGGEQNRGEAPPAGLAVCFCLDRFVSRNRFIISGRKKLECPLLG
jgi:hypothetical protein